MTGLIIAGAVVIVFLLGIVALAQIGDTSLCKGFDDPIYCGCPSCCSSLRYRK